MHRFFLTAFRRERELERMIPRLTIIGEVHAKQTDMVQRGFKYQQAARGNNYTTQRGYNNSQRRNAVRSKTSVRSCISTCDQSTKQLPLIGKGEDTMTIIHTPFETSKGAICRKSAIGQVTNLSVRNTCCALTPRELQEERSVVLRSPCSSTDNTHIATCSVSQAGNAPNYACPGCIP